MTLSATVPRYVHVADRHCFGVSKNILSFGPQKIPEKLNMLQNSEKVNPAIKIQNIPSGSPKIEDVKFSHQNAQSPDMPLSRTYTWCNI